MGTFYLSLIFISNCQSACSQSVVRKPAEAVLHEGFVTLSYPQHLKHPATLTRDDPTWNRDLRAEREVCTHTKVNPFSAVCIKLWDPK